MFKVEGAEARPDRGLPSRKNIFFDLDGTLTDSGSGIINSVQYALDKMALEEPHPEELFRFIGPPLHHTFSTRYGLTNTDTDKAVGFYREYFSEKGWAENQVYPGISAMLGQLAERYRLFVVTSKPEVFARRIIAHFELGPFFENITGSRLDNTMTDKTELIRHTLSTCELDPAATIMVGDRKYDIMGARNNGVTAAGVLYGYGTETELLEHGADHLLRTVSDLGGFLLNE
ncbi:HAD family hydrolase [Niabella drilacis]|uniref:Phosphoglycolate phosphatase n=1 Tax=Niabella drilacis (strain DSM 25811 / CCM 8410 / CCUG 62505 / LMG 26954 / E90) TaxID=1285928 RepID=A0A1G6KKB1_NIADE|nr:HAD family hydrolase [Niabella drilacis]SDC31268.1 phosphoglycolate phosphatase [Niabella drilacis]